jgi:hypothetical protein
MMQKQFKQLVLLAALVPTFAMAQALSNSAPAATAAAAPIDADKKAAIKDLLDAITRRSSCRQSATGRDASEATRSGDPVGRAVGKQDAERQAEAGCRADAAKNAVPKLVDGAGKVFGTRSSRTMRCRLSTTRTRSTTARRRSRI